MKNKKINSLIVPAIIFGETSFWFTVLGVLIGIIGLGWYLIGNSCLISPKSLVNDIWSGEISLSIWQNTSSEIIRQNFWFIKHIHFSDSLAFLGIVICGIAGMIGSWASFFYMLFSKNRKKGSKAKIFLYLEFIIASILLISVLGIGTMH